jgi:hypothetical protein
MTATLFRPVGLKELALIWDSGMREFPPRLPHQPIFYPVATMEYATQIARDWNTRDDSSGFAGYVTRFAVAKSYLERFEPRIVGSSSHVEYWIPAADLSAFNASLQGLISIDAAYFGKEFKGYIPEEFGLRGKDVSSQFVILATAWDYSRMDFVAEVSASRKAVFLNFLYWAQHDSQALGLGKEQRDVIIERLREAWDFNLVDVPLPLVANLPW